MIGPSELARDFWEQGKSSSCPIYDMHGHMGPFHSIYFPRPEAADMLRTMDECGVRWLVFSHHAALNSPEPGNRLAVKAVRQHPDRLRAYCVINPNYPALAEAELDAFDAYRDVYVGLKFHPSTHRVSLSDDRYRPALEFADRHGLLLLTHTWEANPFCGPEAVRHVAERYTRLKLLLGHSLHADWNAAVRISREFPHVYLELTAVFDDRGPIEMFVGEVGSERLLFGTDLPWFDPHQAIGALLSAEVSDEDRHNICHRNAEKLLAPLLAGSPGPQSSSGG